MHAISQEPQPCIYAQLEPCGSISQDEESGEEEEMYPEIRFIPSDANTCKLLMFCFLESCITQPVLTIPPCVMCSAGHF